MPGGNLTRDEARERARLLSVDTYRITLDLSGAKDPDARTFRSSSTIVFSCTTPGASNSTEIQAEINRGLEGRVFEVLIENRDRKGQSRGRTACNRVVHVDAPEAKDDVTVAEVETDAAALPATSLDWWGSQWASDNSPSGGTAPSSFKGFADDVATVPTGSRSTSS